MNLNQAFQVLNNHIPGCPNSDCDVCKEIAEAREVINNTLDSIEEMYERIKVIPPKYVAYDKETKCRLVNDNAWNKMANAVMAIRRMLFELKRK